MTDERPVVHCLIARKLKGGGIGRSRIVLLSTALLAVRAGRFIAVGPDPEDLEKVAAWDRMHPFNPLRLT